MLLRVLQSFWSRFRLTSAWAVGRDASNADVASGVIHHRAGSLAEAEKAYNLALRRNPHDADALHLLGMLAFKRGDLDRAEVLVRDALRTHPASHEILNTLASVLTSMGRHLEAEAALEEALNHAPDAVKARANLLFLLNIIPGISRDRLFAEHVEWANRHCGSQIQKQHTSGEDLKYPYPQSGRLRVGYVSPDFCSHPVGRIISGILKSHDRSRYEIFCYDNGSEKDAINSLLRTYAEHWLEVGNISDQALMERIQSDRIQVLVDLSGHTRKHRLSVFCRKPAPVQATWLGYLNTTGLSAIDWRITDARADPPPQAQGWHVERLWYLPDCQWTWEPSSSALTTETRKLPCLESGYITFGSFNTFRKINDKVILTWSDILRRVPGARLRIHGAPGGKAVDRVYDLFDASGVDPSRIDLFAPVEYERYLHAYNGIDIALDPFPYNGGATTCESLWMGVPVVTLAGDGGFARSGASILGAIGRDELVAKTEAEYVNIAVSLASDWPGLSRMRASLRQEFLASPLTDSKRFALELEKAYEGMWRNRVQGGLKVLHQ